MPVSTEPNLGSILQRPVGNYRGYLQNLLLEPDSDGEFQSIMPFDFRPSQIQENIGVVEDEIAVIGQSHTYDSYSHTNNMRISFELFYNALMMIKENSVIADRGNKEGGLGDLIDMVQSIQASRRFLEALEYPGVTPEGTVGTQRPACLLCLPGIVTMRCRLENLSIRFSRQGVVGDPVEMRANVTFKEAPMGRISMQDVLSVGSFRTWGV